MGNWYMVEGKSIGEVCDTIGGREYIAGGSADILQMKQFSVLG